MKAASNQDVVYVIGPHDQWRVKIGTTSRLGKRPGEIQRMCPIPLEVLWTTPGGRRLEDALHEHFGNRRSHGEWFDFPDGNAVREVQWAVAHVQDPWGWGQTLEGGGRRYSAGLSGFRKAVLAGIRRGLERKELDQLCSIAHISTDSLVTASSDTVRELERCGDHEGAAKWKAILDAACELRRAFGNALPADFDWTDSGPGPEGNADA